MIFSIPCIKNKCITYAVCKGKPIICCSDLMKHFETRIVEVQHSGENINNIGVKNVWLEMNKFLPNMTRIFPDKDGNNIDLNTINYTSFYSASIMRDINREGKKFAIGDRLI